MRRTILLSVAIALMLAMVVASPTAAASGNGPKGGCAATGSGWTLEDVQGSYDLSLSLGAAAGFTEEEIAAILGFTSVEELQNWWEAVFASVDANGDGYLCVKQPRGALVSYTAGGAYWWPWQGMALDNSANASNA